MRVAFFAHSASSNALGRAYSLWLLTRELGWEARVLVPRRAAVWVPLADENDFINVLSTDPTQTAAWADVLVAVKPEPESLGLAFPLHRGTGKPLVVDIDDPDWEKRNGFSAMERVVRLGWNTLHRRKPIEQYRLHRQVLHACLRTISNPELSRWYRGVVIPHVRPDRAPVISPAREGAITVAFVGTPRYHKGVDILRKAVAEGRGTRLVITGNQPADAAEHERWLGATSLAGGLQVVDAADIVAIPSLATPYARAQLPAKLIDAMLSGKAIIASDLPPIRWALGNTGMLVAPGDPTELARGLRRLRDAELRHQLGTQARDRAQALFTPEAVAPSFRAAMIEALEKS